MRIKAEICTKYRKTGQTFQKSIYISLKRDIELRAGDLIVLTPEFMILEKKKELVPLPKYYPDN